KLSGGQLKALYVVSLSEARTAVEVAQRMDVSLDAVTTRGGPYRELGITADSDGYHGNFFEGTSDTAKAEELFNKLDQPYEVIVICGPDLAKIPARCKLKLLQQVQQGAGLVLFDVRDASQQFAALLTKDTLLPSGPVEIFGLAPLREKLAPPATYRLGEGRVVLTRYRLNYSPAAFTSPGWWAEHENAQASLLRTLLWAARREPGVRLASPALEQDPLLPRQEQRLPIELLAERPGKLEARLRDEWNHTVRTDTLAYTGSGAIQYTLPKLPGGRYYLDLRALEGEVTHNFGFYPFRVESPVQAELVNPDDAVEGFSPIRATLKLDRPLPGAVARISLVDSPYGRIWYRRDIPLGDGTETILEARDYFMPTLAAFLRVDLLQGEETLGWTTTTYFFPYYTQHLPTYSGFSWDSQAPQPPLRNMAEYDDLGHMGIVTVMGGGWAPVTHYWLMNKQVMAHPWALHLAVGKEGQWNYRVPSWTKSVMDPADWERYGAVESYSPGDPEAHKMDAAVTRAIGKYCKFDRYPMAAYPMGNEVQVRYDGGFSPPDEIAFRAMLE
ncbi:MAG: hypothetical protein GX100_14095, partial [candidate division WS1 bacterium]|nr:hypothetical protein [candidate division WS1 bacterium]